MPPLKRGETFATGMVKPKTTALFFDKLWVHPLLIQGFGQKNYTFRNDLEPHHVPAELCVWVCPVFTDCLPLSHGTSSQSNLFVL